MLVFHRGASLTVLITDDAIAARREAENRVPGNKKACIARVRALLARLADRGELRVPDEFRCEGNDVWAVKGRCGLRAYGWFGKDSRGRRAFIVAHYILKKHDKARKTDLKRVENARADYEREQR